ncbi:MAG: DUF362 domain-containing protein [Oscillospiraceae bacterium]
MQYFERDVSITSTKSYDKDEVISSIRRHFELLKLHELIKPEMKVLLKPNLLMKRRPEETTTTHPVVVGGIIACLKEIGVTNITIADSPGGPYTKSALTGIYEASGMRAIAEEYNVQLNWDFDSFEQTVDNGVMVKSFTLINPVKDADFIIDIAKLKTHAMTTLSGGVKNLFGTVPGLMKPEFHWRFPEKDNFCNMLLDLCSTVKPDVTFVDAIVSMEGNGPSGGTPKNTDMILASRSAYNMDIVLCKVIGIKVSDAPTVYNAIKRGLSVSGFSMLNIIGDNIKCFDDYKIPQVRSLGFYDVMPKFLIKPIRPIMDRFLSSKPVIQKKKCIGCAKCSESCPADTISIIDKKAIIDYSKCIKCFCCHEMCPVKAIEIKRLKMFDF